MMNATSSANFLYLRQVFAQFGIPESVFSDNCTQFVAAEFKESCQMNDICHIHTAPYHLSPMVWWNVLFK